MQNQTPVESISVGGKTVKFTFNTGALSILRRELGYSINYNIQPAEQLEAIPNIEDFFADFLFAAAKFHSRKDPDFTYDRDDAHDWIKPFGGIEMVTIAFALSQRPGIEIPEGIVIPQDSQKKAPLKASSK